jgi:predicted metal-dependent hydrolase
MNHQIKFGSKQIDFTLEFANRKSLGIKVHPDRKVEVIAPLHTNEIEITERVRKKAPWILKQMDHFSAFLPVTPPRRFVSGETHLFLGRQYRLKVIPDSHDAIKAYRSQLWMYSRSSNPEVLKQQLNGWYKCKAFIIFSELLEETFPKFKRYQIAAPALTIRRMTKRWGSCTPSGRIILNTELIKAPKGCIEYVIMHELCHTVYHSHSKRFRNLLNRMMPDQEKWKKILENSLI